MPASDRAPDSQTDLELLHDAVREAGALALQHFHSRTEAWTKDDGTPVSDADLAVNAMLQDRLTSVRPGYGWLSEETSDTGERLNNSRVWVVDPIDGTRSFLKGSENWSVAVALVDAGRPVLGSVFAPATGNFYCARSGHGARCNAKPLTASARSELAGARFIAHEKVLRQDRWQRPWPQVTTGMTTSLALRLCLVADGTFDATLALGDKCDWDLAAGDLIVHEAGGCVSRLDGSKMTYNQVRTRQSGLVASGHALHGEILDRTKGYKGA